MMKAVLPCLKLTDKNYNYFINRYILKLESQNETLFQKITSPFKQIIDTQQVSDMGAVPIPPRQAEHRPSRQPQPTTTPYVSINISSPRTTFLDQARKLVDKRGSPCEHVPFMHYWPTYEAMNHKQQAWYFYWRSQVRVGNYLYTDTSYLFVHIYEVINLIGFANPQDAFEYLVVLYKHYRVENSKLDSYLADWLADFIILHNLGINPLEWYSQVQAWGGETYDYDLALEIWLNTSKNFENFSNYLLFKLADYSPKKNKFYQIYNLDNKLDSAYRLGLDAIDKYLRETSGKGLFETFQPDQKRTITREPFASAIHESDKNKIIIAEVHPWFSSETLSLRVRSIIKRVENLLRKQENFQGRLRGIDLPQEWNAVLEEVFVPVKTEQKEQIAETKPQIEVTINWEEVAKLKQETQKLQKRLFVEDEISQEETEIITEIAEIQVYPEESFDLTLERPIDTPDGLLTELEEVLQLLTPVESTAMKIAKLFYEHDWFTSIEDMQSILDGVFVNVVIDQINEQSHDLLGDSLFFEEDNGWTVSDDFRDEIEFIITNLEAVQTEEDDNKYEDMPSAYSDLLDEYAELAKRFEGHHWDAIAAMLDHDNTNNKLEPIARSKFSTPNQLIDDINEIALEAIDDNIIDDQSFSIVEEYHEPIANLLNWALANRLME